MIKHIIGGLCFSWRVDEDMQQQFAENKSNGEVRQVPAAFG